MKIFNNAMGFVFLTSGVLFLCEPEHWVSTWLGTINGAVAYLLAAILFFEHAADSS